MMRPDGTAAEPPAPPPARPAGARLTEAQVRQVRDLVYCLLRDTLGLSPADARRVGRSMPVGKRSVERRTRRVARGVERYGVLPLMFGVVGRAGSRDAG